MKQQSTTVAILHSLSYAVIVGDCTYVRRVHEASASAAVGPTRVGATSGSGDVQARLGSHSGAGESAGAGANTRALATAGRLITPPGRFMADIATGD